MPMRTAPLLLMRASKVKSDQKEKEKVKGKAKMNMKAVGGEAKVVYENGSWKLVLLSSSPVLLTSELLCVKTSYS